MGVRLAARGPGGERVASGQKRGLSQPRGPDVSAAGLLAAWARAHRGPETSLAPHLGQRQPLAAGRADPGWQGRRSDRRHRAGGYRVGHPERAVVGALGPGFLPGAGAGCRRRHRRPILAPAESQECPCLPAQRGPFNPQQRQEVGSVCLPSRGDRVRGQLPREGTLCLKLCVP